MRSVLLAVALMSSSAGNAAPPEETSKASPQPAVATQVDPAALAASERFLDAINFDRLMDQTTEAMVAEIKRSLPAQLEKMSEKPLPPQLQEKLIGIIMDSSLRSIRDNKAAVRQGTALIYARHFTAAEIGHMAAMMKDPVMIKMQAKMPQIMAESMALSTATMEKEMPRMLEELKRLVAEYEEAPNES